MTIEQERPLRGVVAIGGSAGGVEALSQTAAGFPADLPFAVLMALHLPAQAPSVLADIVNRRTALEAVAAQDGMSVEPGRIYVAVPGRHLLARDHRIVLSEGPTENGYRPALNALFRSVAVAFGPQAVGVLVSGVLDDGVLGLAAIRSRGGTTICQDPEEALFPAMPRNALHAGVVDRIARAADIGALLAQLALPGARTADAPLDPALESENRIAMSHRFDISAAHETFDQPAGYTCPDCNGPLHFASADHFRCHVGHAWTAEALIGAQDREFERALWMAIQSLIEKRRLAHQLAEKATSPAVKRRYSDLAGATDTALAVLREKLSSVPGGMPPAE
ncbi:MAG: chemotaxis protein CheB [Mycobacterium kyogaense]|uniref:chemotaxis protein CheB n=1 Tax=Mycobacterium kyogaense TaxID=2212479 RepID=UPI002FF5D3CB